MENGVNMSIVFDFPAIKSRIRGDDWWEPVKMERAHVYVPSMYTAEIPFCDEGGRIWVYRETHWTCDGEQMAAGPYASGATGPLRAI